MSHAASLPLRARAALAALRRDSSPSAVLSGLVAVVVGFAGPTVLVFAVSQAAGLGDRAVMSWVWASTVLCGLTSVYLSLRTRLPILSTWSTPGIAFLATALPGVPFAEAVGAFVVSALLVTLIGSVAPLARLLGRIPAPVAAALNAAILLPFGFRAVQAAARAPLLVGAMVLAYFALRRLAPRWAVAGVLVVGVAASAALGLLHGAPPPLAPTVPQFVRPEFTLRAALDLALPLTLLAFTGQFVPGFAVLRASGFAPEPGPVLRACGVASLGAALVGCHNLTLGALLANIVSGPEAHPDPARRYTAAVWAGAFFVLFGLFSGTFLGVMGLLPTEAVQALAGLALLGATASSLAAALGNASGSLAAPSVLIVALSGVTPFGLGAAFWGVLAGLAVHGAEERAARRAARREAPTAPVRS